MDLYINFTCGGPIVFISRNLMQSYINEIYFCLYDYKRSQPLPKRLECEKDRLIEFAYIWFCLQ